MMQKRTSLIALLGFLPWLPLVATQVTSPSNTQDQSISIALRFSQDPATDCVLGTQDISTIVYEDLTDIDYAKIKHLSKAWRAMMLLVEANENNLLLLPPSNKLVAFTNNLFAHASNDDPAHVAIINTLKTLALRSHDAGNIFYEAFRQYQTDVPNEKERICSPCTLGKLCMNPMINTLATLQEERHGINTLAEAQGHGVEQLEPDDLFEVLEEKHKAIQKSQHMTLEQLKPLLTKWQPYGVFLKFAKLYQAQIRTDYPSKLNVLDAPQMSASQPEVHPENPLFVCSNRCYIHMQQRLEDQYIEACNTEFAHAQHEIEHDKNNDRATRMLIDSLNWNKQDLRVHMIRYAKKAYIDGECDRQQRKEYISRAAQLLLAMDEIPSSEYLVAAGILKEAAIEDPARSQIYLRRALECSAKEAQTLYKNRKERAAYAVPIGNTALHTLRVSLDSAAVLHARTFILAQDRKPKLIDEQAVAVLPGLKNITDIRQDQHHPDIFEIFLDDTKACTIYTDNGYCITQIIAA